MGHYKANLRDIEFNLFEVLGRDKLYGTGPFEEMDVDTAKSILEELARLSENELAESFADADRSSAGRGQAGRSRTTPGRPCDSSRL